MPALPSDPIPALAAVAAPFGRDLEAGFARIERTLAAARARGARLVAFPESALGGYLREPAAGEPGGPQVAQALDLDGPEIARLCRLAGDTVVCAGFTERGPHGPHSTAVCVTGDGVLGVHRKVHIPPGERFVFRAGSGFAPFDTPAGRVGMVLCYDKLFPEGPRKLALDGAQIIVSLAAWAVDRIAPASRVDEDRQTHHFDAIDVARAIENQVTVVSSNLTGRLGARRFVGHAKVVDPHGAVLAATGARGGLAVGAIDPATALRDARALISHLRDRRPTAYVAAPGHGMPVRATG